MIEQAGQLSINEPLFQIKQKLRGTRIMMISVGDKHFIDSDHIVEILHPVSRRAKLIRHIAAVNGRLIDSTGGDRIRSIIKLKSRHIVLSTLDVKIVKSKIKRTIIPGESRNSVKLGPEYKTPAPKSKSSDTADRRIEPDRRNFTYTCHVPERRSGTERRKK